MEYCHSTQKRSKNGVIRPQFGLDPKNYDRNSFLGDYATLESIKGIVFRKNNIPTKTGPSEVIKNLDELPFPARDLMPMERYVPFPNAYKRLPASGV